MRQVHVNMVHSHLGGCTGFLRRREYEGLSGLPHLTVYTKPLQAVIDTNLLKLSAFTRPQKTAVYTEYLLLAVYTVSQRKVCF